MSVAYRRFLPPEREYDASDAWLADLVTAALTLVRAAAAESEDAVAALAALERRVAWEGPAAREFRTRADGLRSAGSASATSLEALVDDLRALRRRMWALTRDAAHGG